MSLGTVGGRDRVNGLGLSIEWTRAEGLSLGREGGKDRFNGVGLSMEKKNV